MIDILSYFLIFVGLLMIATAVMGCNRLPDYFTKMHAVTVGDVVGCPLILVGFALQANSSIMAIKLILLALILLVINPTASYVLNRIALKQGLSPELKKDDIDV
jgi:multicomponent Na+:H+ antiporter subunit G